MNRIAITLAVIAVLAGLAGGAWAYWNRAYVPAGTSVIDVSSGRPPSRARCEVLGGQWRVRSDIPPNMSFCRLPPTQYEGYLSEPPQITDVGLGIGVAIATYLVGGAVVLMTRSLSREKAT